MAGSKQSKRVSWPSDGNLCKVRLFLSEDAPYQSGHNTQDHLQAKTAWLLHAGGLNEPDDSLPPGFEAPYRNHPIIDISQIPVIKWQHPHKFVLNQEWRVVAGEESQECSIENTRQQGALEAIYPRPSSIPPNPLISPDVQTTHTMDDAHIPLIPITAPEDEDTAEQHQDQSNTLSPTNHHHAPPHNHNYPTVQTVNSYKPELSYAPTNFPSHNIPRLGAEPDITAAASVALTAIVKSSEEGSLIDRDLLVKLLSDPSMMNKLLSSNHHSSYIPPQASNHSNIHCPRPPPPPPPPSVLPNLHFGASSERAAAVGAASSNQVKDVNYYKSLIQMHGREQQQESSSAVTGNMNQQRVVDFKAKVQKPCTYFNTPRGCRNGASCLFLHDASLNVDQQTGPSKRVKLDGGITGRN